MWVALACALALGVGLGAWPAPAGSAPLPKPNIVLILADDLGYGDVQCNYPAGKIPTPHLDRLAAGGLRFTDAHTTSSVCTPTRYSLLTGRYNWRTRLQQGVLGGLSPSLIEPGRLTLAGLLREHGYHTAVIGKWHLGLDWVLHPDRPPPERNTIERSNQFWSVDFTLPFGGGPRTVGFEYFFGIAGSLDMVPYTYLENDRVTVVPTVDRQFPLSPGRRGGQTRRGPGTPDFEAEQVLPTLTRQAVDYIGQRAAEARAGRPFFLYLPLNSPHTPIAPVPPWRGQSGLNAYADFVMQTDASVGQVLEALHRHGLTESTLVLFTSDNGCSPEADLPALRAAGHAVSGPWRGHKADLWEGGHRVPFIVRWPGQVPAGSVSTQLVSLVDVLATCAELLGAKLPEEAGEDSVSFLSVLRGRADGPRRDRLVHHSIQGRFALREGRWKLLLCPGSGGWSAPTDAEALKQGLPKVQLYDLATDPGETRNLQAEHPELVARLLRQLERDVAQGRSTPGRPQTNNVPVDIWKEPGRSPTRR